MNQPKIIFYTRGGLGDMYGFFSMLPDLLRSRNISMDNILFYIDSLYILYPNQFPNENKSLFSMLLAAGIDKINIIPESESSAAASGCSMTSPDDLINGACLDRIEYNFMFWRSQKTINFMKKILENNPCATFIDLPITEQIFEWKENKYHKLTEYERTPLTFMPSGSEKRYVDSILKTKHILIHVRVKGFREKTTDVDQIIDLCDELSITPILIGLQERAFLRSLSKHANLKTIDTLVDLRNNHLSFDGQMYLSEKAKYMVTSSSGFTFHRICAKSNGARTIIRIPYCLGSPKGYLHHKYVEDKDNIILDSDIDNISDILETIRQDDKDGKI
jgi:hypothetical protein